MGPALRGTPAPEPRVLALLVGQALDARVAGGTMNLLLLAGFALGLFGWLWLVQTLALLSEGPARIWVLPFRHRESRRVRMALKLGLGCGIIGVLLLYPWSISDDPIRYHAAKFIP